MRTLSLVYWATVPAFLLGVGIVWRLRQRLPAPEEKHRLTYLALIPGVAGIAYALMALGIGTVTLGGQALIAPRYVDWLITTPLLVGFAGYAAGAPRRRITAAMLVDIAMVTVGAAAVVASGSIQWILFAVSSACYLGLLWYLYAGFSRTLTGDPDQLGLFKLVRNHVGLLWFAYPFVWAAGPNGVGVATLTGVTMTFAFLDVAAKVPYVYFFYIRLNYFQSSTTTAESEPSSMPTNAGIPQVDD